MDNSDTSPRDITTDHETIREWVEDRGGRPAHMTGKTDDTARTLYIVEEGEAMEGLEPIPWEAFFETFEDEALAFVYQDRELGETDEWLYDLVDRDEVAEQAAIETTDVEAALLDGEVVRSELTETKVVETTVVETDQIESEVVDSELIERTVVDREPIGRELVGIEFTDAPAELPASLSTEQQDVTQRLGPETDEVDRAEQSTMDAGTGMESETGSRSEMETERTETEAGTGVETETTPGTETDEPIAEPVDETTAEPATDRQHSVEPTPGLGVGNGVVLDVHETVLTTVEEFDRKTVESRVVEQEITEEDTVESDAIDIEGIEASLLESDVIQGEVVTDETGEAAGLPSGAITSERTEGETIRSQFVERRLVEIESTDHHRLMCDITDYELVDIVDSRSTITERAIVDRETDEAAMLHQPEAGVRTTDEQLTAAEESATAPTADAELAAEPEGEAGETGAARPTGETGEAPSTEASTGAKAAITDDEVGKRVVSGDEELGIVSDVDTESQTLYVEPEPSLADRIKAALDWGDTDDSYPVSADQIEAVDDEVRVSKQ